MGEKKRKQKKKAAKKQTVDLTLRLNVELDTGKKQQPRRERVRRITSRKRANLREMRRAMPMAGAQSFGNPAFYGNVKLLSNSAMNQFQNQRYSLEQQVRESSAEQRAMLAAGRAKAAQQAAEALATQTKQLADLQQRFGFQSQQLAQVSAAAGVERGKAQTLEQQQQQQAIEQQYAVEEEAKQKRAREEKQAEAEQLSDQEVKERISALPAFAAQDFSPEAIKPAKFKETEGLMRRVIAFGEKADEIRLYKAFQATDRARGKSKSRAKRAAEEQAQQEQQEPEVEPEPQPVASPVTSDEEDVFEDPTQQTTPQAEVRRSARQAGGGGLLGTLWGGGD